MTWPVSQHSPKPGEWQWQFKNSTGQSMLRWWTFAISFSQASQSGHFAERQTCRDTHSHPQPKEENKINLAKICGTEPQKNMLQCHVAELNILLQSRSLSNSWSSTQETTGGSDACNDQSTHLMSYTDIPCCNLRYAGGPWSVALHWRLLCLVTHVGKFSSMEDITKITRLWSISTLSFASFSLSLRAKAEKLGD